jgi:hypothetical protein
VPGRQLLDRERSKLLPSARVEFEMQQRQRVFGLSRLYPKDDRQDG